MKKSLFMSAAIAALALGTASAQDLDTVNVADQFNVGARGNEAGTGGSFGASATDGTEFLDYSGADATGTIT